MLGIFLFLIFLLFVYAMVLQIQVLFSFKIGMGLSFSIFLILIIGIPIILYKIVKRTVEKREHIMKVKLHDPKTSEEEKEKINEYFRQQNLKVEQDKEIERFKARRNEGLKGSLESVFYLGGHEKIAYSQKVDIYLYQDRIVFYPANQNNILFTITGDQIDNVKYETISENTKDLILGLSGATVPISEITQIMVIYYTSNHGIKNEISISTGGQQDRNLYGLVNVIRNDGQVYRNKVD